MYSNYFSLFLFLFLAVFVDAQSTLQLSANHIDARYEINERIQIEVTGNNGKASYRIWQDQYTPIIQEGEVEIQNGIGTIEFQHSKAALVVCEVEQNNEKANLGIAIEPFAIDALEKEPEDFDAFWDEAKAELQNVPLNAQLSFHSEDNHSKTYRINLANINDRRVYGYISIPKGSGAFPAMLILPPYGFTPNLVSPKQNICRDIGMIALSLSIHNVEPDTRDPNAYMPNDISDPYGNYYRQAVMGALQAINYLFTRDDFSGDLIVSGVSQGAGLAIMTAGLEERVKLLNFSGVTHAQHQGKTYEEASGFPYYLHQVRNFPQAMHTATKAASHYYESIYFARRYKGKTLMAIGYLDDVTHPTTQLPVFNALSGEKILIHSQKTAHMHPSEFWRLRYEMGLQNFPYARAFAWQFATKNNGYHVDAGKDTSINIEEELQLDARVIFNEETLENREIEWELVEGTGEIEWRNQNSLNPTLSFSEAGTYVLKLRAHDYQDLEEKATYYTLEDEVTIIVEEREIESFLFLTCAGTIEFNLPIGVEKGIIEWQLPGVSSVCELGEATLTQISGAQSGEELAAGIYTIEYLATNPCGDSRTCKLTINVLYHPLPESGYCNNQGEQPWEEWIQEVKLSDLRLFSQKEGYGDFLNYSASLEAAATYNMNIQIGYSYMDTTEHIAAYIDFNQDSTFQTEERILQAAFTTPDNRSGARTFQTTIAIPPNVPLGKTRMRVLLSKATENLPCEPILYGEVEDYTIFFTEGEKAQDSTAVYTSKHIDYQDIKLFPNPVNNQLNISFEHLIKGDLLLRIFDDYGRLVGEQNLQINAKQEQQSVETAHFENGVYFVQLLSAEEVVMTRRIVRMKE